VWLLALLLAVDDVQPDRKLVVAIDETVEVDVGYAVGVRCDDLKIIDAEMKAKSDTANAFVVKGIAEGRTLCRVGTGAQGPTILFDVQVVPKKPRKR
jgi:hypothetical protein